MKNIESRLRSSMRNSAKSRAMQPDAMMMESAGQELKKNPPAILAKTRKKKGKKAAEKQRIAIMFSKAKRGK